MLKHHLPQSVLISAILVLASCGGGGGGGGSNDNDSNNDNGQPGSPTPNQGTTPIGSRDANYGLEGRYYSSNGEFLDLKSGLVYTIAPQFDDSDTYPSTDGTEFVETIENYRFVRGIACGGFGAHTELVAIRDAQTGQINDSFEITEDIYSPVRMSRDNQYIAFLWDDDGNCNSETQLSVFTRQGNLLYQATESIYDFDWLSDNRMVLTDGDNIMVEQTALSLNVITYPIPSYISGEAGNLRVSPDDNRLLFEMVTDRNSFLSTVNFREATVWEFNLNTLEFKQYITSRRDGEEPQINTPIWSPDGQSIIVTEDYTSGVASTITPGDYLTGWEGWRDLIIVPLDVSGVNYVFSANESEMVLPPPGNNSARPIFSYESDEEEFFRLSPFYRQSWAPTPGEAPTPSAGSLPSSSSAPHLGLTGNLYFTDEGNNENFVLKRMNLANRQITELFQLSDNDSDRVSTSVFPSDDNAFYGLYDYRGLEDKVLMFFSQQGNLEASWQMYNGTSYDLSPLSRLSFSPDGNWVTFVAENENNNSRKIALVFDWRNGRFINVFTDREYDSAEWMPNGNLLLFSESEVYLSTVSGENFSTPSLQFQLSGNVPHYPDISPDGSQIAFSIGYHIWTVNIDGSNLRQLTAMSDSFERYPTWSPDGNYIIFQRYEDDDKFGDYWIIAADASAVPVWESRAVTQALPVSETPSRRLGKYGPVHWR